MIYPPDIPLEVCDKFMQLALEIKRDHHLRRYSADAILHRIRWHFRFDQGQGKFKCNNNWTSKLARWAMDENPELEKFFATRQEAAGPDWIDP